MKIDHAVFTPQSVAPPHNTVTLRDLKVGHRCTTPQLVTGSWVVTDVTPPEEGLLSGWVTLVKISHSPGFDHSCSLGHSIQFFRTDQEAILLDPVTLEPLTPPAPRMRKVTAADVKPGMVFQYAHPLPSRAVFICTRVEEGAIHGVSFDEPVVHSEQRVVNIIGPSRNVIEALYPVLDTSAEPVRDTSRFEHDGPTVPHTQQTENPDAVNHGVRSAYNERQVTGYLDTPVTLYPNATLVLGAPVTELPVE